MPREQRRAQLLDVASDVIGERGYHSASMDDIAEAAGVSKPVLYQHFSSKHALYLALVDRARALLVDRIDEALASPANRDRVWATIDTVFSFITNSGSHYRFVFESDLAADPQVQEILSRAQAEIGSSIGAVIAAETDLDHEEATLLGVGLAGIAQQSARHWRDATDRGDAEISAQRARDLTATLCWRGVAAFPRTGTDQ